MTTDPRHGTVAGYNRIPCREECCKRAMATYKARWEWDHMNGKARIISSVGTRRRIEALAALGWSHEAVGKHMGMTGTNLVRLRKSSTINAATAAKVAVAFEELCMRLPTGRAQSIATVQSLARKNGWAPPLAWDDIDDPDEHPSLGMKGRPQRAKTELDHARVERFLAGETDLHTTNAEKREILRRWIASGRSERALCMRVGWRMGRYVGLEEAS